MLAWLFITATFDFLFNWPVFVDLVRVWPGNTLPKVKFWALLEKDCLQIRCISCWPANSVKVLIVYNYTHRHRLLLSSI